MAAHKNSFANRIRTAAVSFGPGRDISAAELSSAAGLMNRQEEKKMSNAVGDMIRSGEMVRVRRGVYRYVSLVKKIDKRQVMWRILKMRRLVLREDLEEMAGVSRSYAEEWLRNLVRHDVVRKIKAEKITEPCKYQLIDDCATMPDDEKKAAKLRALRAAKKRALNDVLDKIAGHLTTARQKLNDL